jgi:hypothetical protein
MMKRLLRYLIKIDVRIDHVINAVSAPFFHRFSYFLQSGKLPVNLCAGCLRHVRKTSLYL